MAMSAYADRVLQELQQAIRQIDGDALAQLANAVVQADQIFVAGAGRSGLMMRAFAMRLMHLGLRAYVVGETVTPSLTARGLLVIGSGSGETGTLAGMAKQAKKHGADVALITISPQSSIGQMADHLVQIPASAKDASDSGAVTVQPMGSLFEQSLLLTLDALILQLMDQTETNASLMYKRHANLE